VASEVYEFAEGFQLKILASMARDRSFFITYQEILEPKYFRKDIHIDMARILHDYYEQEMARAKKKSTDVNPPTLEVLFEEVRKLTKNPKKAQIRDQYQDAIVDMVELDLSDIEYVKDSVISFGRQAAMQHAILESVDILESGKEEDFAKIEEKIRHALSVGEDIEDLGTDYFEEAEQRTQEYATGTDGTRRVPTGLEGVDKVMKGGLGDGELGVIIAPPNRGKSIALTNIGAGAVLTGHNVFHYTLEMPERQVSKRYDLRMTNKNFDYLRENASKVLTAIHNIQKIHKGHLIIKKYRTNEATVNTIRSHITRTYMEKGIKPDLLIVDYADLLTPTRSYSDKRFELESIYLALRDLGDEFGCPVWTASQASRGALDKKIITIADLAEAFLKANIADFMVALCQTIEEKDDGIMRWHVAKHRDGEASMTLDGDVVYETSKMSVFTA
jgi:replicative DNA helicase